MSRRHERGDRGRPALSAALLFLLLAPLLGSAAHAGAGPGGLTALRVDLGATEWRAAAERQAIQTVMRTQAGFRAASHW